MKNKYYDLGEFQNAMKFLESDPFIARKRMEDYLEVYPYDYYARAYYINILIRIHEFDKAIEEFDSIINEEKSVSKHMIGNKNINGFMFNMILSKVRLLSAFNKFEELYEYIKQFEDYFIDGDKKYLNYYCKIKLGILEQSEYNEDAYRFNQVNAYSEEAFKEHVKEHLAAYNESNEKPNPAVFLSNFPFEEVLEEVKKHIPSDNYLFKGYFEDEYYFKFDNCGRADNRITDYFIVVCFHDNHDFITMYPTTKGESIPYVDLNKLQKEEPKIKRLSQIEKFNKKYNIK